MRCGLVLVVALGIGLMVIGCTLEIPGVDSLLPASSFVVKGTAAVDDQNGPCRIWYGENGFTYYLFQDPRVDNETFDRVITPGVTSRLELLIRADLEVTCQVDRKAEVVDVLEIED
jgi:hypothetical protein